MSRTFRWPRGSSVPILAAALCLLLAPAAEGGQLLCDGVALDGAAAYAMSPGGGIEAIDLESGAVLWSSSAAAKPLHLAEGLLIAQGDGAVRGAVELAALDAGTGARRHAMIVDLPPQVWTAVDDGPGRSFRCHAGGRAGDLAVSWRESRPVEGRFAVHAPALDESSGPVIASAAPSGSLSGAARLDLVSGSVTAAEPAAVGAGSLSAPRHESGVLLAGVEGRQYLSADGAHVLASVRTSDPGDWRKYRWSVYTAAGALVGTIDHHTATAPFVVRGSTIVFRDQPYTLVVEGAPASEPMALRGVDLTTGAEVWSRELRDTAYRGPFPP